MFFKNKSAKSMFRFFGCVIFMLPFLTATAFANTALYKKDNFKINVTGYADGQFGSKDGGTARHNLYNGISIYDKKNGVPISAAIRINNGSNATESYGGTAIEDAYIRIGDGTTDSNDRYLAFKEESMGRLEFGITGPTSEKLRISSSEFSRGTGGISGDWFRFVKYNLDSSTTILNPQMPITNGFTTSTYAAPVTNVLQDYYSGSQALKLNVYSPKFNGFILGVGFTPSLYDRYSVIGLQRSYGQATSDPNNNFNTKNSFSSVLYYDKKLSQNIKVLSSLIWEHGTATKLNNAYSWAPRENLDAWMWGSTLAYKNWHFGGSYSSYGKSLYFKDDGTANTLKLNKDGTLSRFSKAYFYDIGLGYEEENWGASLTYFASSYAANTVSVAMLSVDRIFFKNGDIGLKTYAEAGYADITHSNFYDGNGNIVSNKKVAGIIFSGIRATF